MKYVCDVCGWEYDENKRLDSENKLKNEYLKKVVKK